MYRVIQIYILKIVKNYHVMIFQILVVAKLMVVKNSVNVGSHYSDQKFNSNWRCR